MSAGDLPVVLWAALCMFAGGALKGAVGMGMPLVAVPLLSLVLPVPVAVGLLTVPILASNLRQAFAGGYFRRMFARFWPLIAATVVGVVFGAHLLRTLDRHVLYAVLGGGVILYVLVGRYTGRVHFGGRAERLVGVAVGLGAGTVGGMSSIYAPLIVPYMVTLRLERDDFVGALGTIYLIAVLPQMIAFGAFGVMSAGDFVRSALATLPVVAGMMLGERLRRRINQAAFRRAVLVVLLVSGVALLLRAVR